MTKYIVFINPTPDVTVNEPGSREEMACDIAIYAEYEQMPKNYYVAFASDSIHVTMELLRGEARFSLQIDDERADLWEQEISQIIGCGHNVHDAMWDSRSQIVKAMQEFNRATQSSTRFQDLPILRSKSIDEVFGDLDLSAASTDISIKVSEIFEVKDMDE